MGWGEDLQRGAQMRLEFLIIAIIVWICLLPVGYLLLWKAASAGEDGGAGCLGKLFGIPNSLEDARRRFITVNIVLLICIASIIIGCIAAVTR